MKRIPPARIEWRDATPSSPEYKDVYFSRDGGPDEVRHVFLAGNDLPERFAGDRAFTIGETGFGTGLNFLVTLAAWREQAPAEARLHYLSIEKHPFDIETLEQVHSRWPELAKEARTLRAIYPPLVTGMHHRQWFDGRITLALLFGEVEAMLAAVTTRVDAWYLDGFAPGKNPAMWTPAVFEQVARLTRPGGTVATYTAAGAVRRGLEAAGFALHKRPGYGRKREMLAGRLAAVPPISLTTHPWFVPARSSSSETGRRAIVIGAGIAGVSAAHALAERGWRVTLVEKRDRVAAEASGNPSGVVLPRLTADMDRQGRFSLAAFLHTTAWLNRLAARRPDLSWQPGGVLQLLDAKRQAQLDQLDLPASILECVDQATASERAGMAVASGGVIFPGGGWLRPPALCQALLADQADRITVRTGREIVRLERDGSLWQLEDSRGEIATAPVVVLATGEATGRWVPDLGPELESVRGQLTCLPATPGTDLQLPVCHAGYVIPAHEGRHTVGATYHRDDACREPRPEDDASNLAALARAVPAFAGATPCGGRVAFRTGSPDHLPIIGPVPDFDFYRRAYADLRHGRPVHRYPAARYRPNLFVSTAHGSRGLITAPFAAAWIAACLEAQPLPLENDVLEVVHPARFLIRRLKRGVV